jgi:hypothetical protein
LLDRIEENARFHVEDLTGNQFATSKGLFGEYERFSFVDAAIVAYMQAAGLYYLYAFDDDFDGAADCYRLVPPPIPTIQTDSRLGLFIQAKSNQMKTVLLAPSRKCGLTSGQDWDLCHAESRSTNPPETSPERLRATDLPRLSPRAVRNRSAPVRPRVY